MTIRQAWKGWLFALPALAFFLAFCLYPLIVSVQYSFFNWDGIGKASWAGIDNYINLFLDETSLAAIIHAFVLVIFFSFIPLTIALVCTAFIRDLRSKKFRSFTQAILFLPQIIPGAAAAVAWMWMYSRDGVINQVLGLVGMAEAKRAWLGDFDWALPAIGVIGIWLETGFCTLLLNAGLGKIDQALYEAADIDGASEFKKFQIITLPGLRNEITICLMLTIITSLSSFDVVFMATGGSGGPGFQTMVPGVLVYNLAFVSNNIGAASAMAVILAIIVLAIIVPIQRNLKVGQ